MKCLRLLVYWVCVGVDVSLDVLRYAKKYEGMFVVVVLFVVFCFGCDGVREIRRERKIGALCCPF